MTSNTPDLAPDLAPDLIALKRRLRAERLAARDALAPADHAAAGRALAAASLPFATAGLVVSGFWPIKSEIDPRPLMARLAADGAHLALPRIDAGRLSFRRWREGEALVPGGFGTSVPDVDAEPVDPDVLLVPLAAFDRRGGRIGYGKGHYDTELARLSGLKPVRTLGLAFAVQEVATVPEEPHDRRLDAILTERELIRP